MPIDYKDLILTKIHEMRKRNKRPSYILVTNEDMANIEELEGFIPCWRSSDVIQTSTIYGLAIAILTGDDGQPMVIM